MMLFSVIIPVYNGAKYLRECLDSILVSSDKWATELICVDDGSSDESGRILDEYAARDSRFKVIHQANSGVSAARNAALEIASGKYVCFADADDVVDADWLQLYANAFGAEDIDVVRQACEDGEWAREGYPWMFALRRELALKARFPEGVAMSEDEIYILRLYPYVRRIVTLNRRTYHHIDRPNSAMVRSLESHERLLYFTALADCAQAHSQIDRMLVSEKCAESIMAWLSRPKDLVQAHLIREQWCRLRCLGCTSGSRLSIVLRPGYALYAYLPWTLPARVWCRLVRKAVSLRAAFIKKV